MKSSNFDIHYVSVAAPPTANTEFGVTHNMGSVPLTGFVVRTFGSGDLYLGTTAWTNTTVYFKSTLLNGRFVVALLR